MLAYLIHALQCRDIFDGKLFGSAPSVSTARTSGIIKLSYSGNGFSKKVQFCQASLVADAPGDSVTSIHKKNPWISDVELTAEQIALLKWSFKCVVCHCNGHVIQFCIS